MWQVTWLAFISSVIGSLAWPTVIGFLAFAFRDQVATALKRLTTAKAFGSEFVFAQALDKAESLASPPLQPKPELITLNNPALPEENISQPQSSVDGKIPLAPRVVFRPDTRTDIPPEYRIISAWKFLYSEISRLASGKGAIVRGFLSYPEIRELGPLVGLSTERIAQVNELRKLRNRAANEPDWTLTLTDALRYEDIVTSLLEVMEEAAHDKEPS
jgi:hypothetical protein